MDLTTLDALLLFLVGQKGQSGYEVRQLMQSTPLGLFSDSPGAIYPALARLERRGLLTGGAAAGGRRKRTYERTEAGAAALAAWLVRPVQREDVQRHGEMLTLRYVMTAEALGGDAALKFLQAWESVEAAYLSEIESYQTGAGRDAGAASRAAVDLGVRLVRARLAWAREILSNEGEGR